MDYDPTQEEPMEDSFVVLACGCITTLDSHCGKLIHRHRDGRSAEWVYRKFEDIPLFIRESEGQGCIPLAFRVDLHEATDLTLEEFERMDYGH